jgi:23S rRNA (adenine1618-N6)-methyltransferase
MSAGRTSSEEKSNLHPRNKHKSRYDFQQLILSSPELGKYVALNPYNNLSIDFNNPDAVKALNRALLIHFYKVKFWDLPEGFLCPPIPGRADYIHNIADLLSNDGIVPTGKEIKVLDIGVGANCIYPLIGNHEYGWSFIGSDIDIKAIQSAQSIVRNNALTDVIEIRKQNSINHIFKGILEPGETIHVSICNPPFHSSEKDASAGTTRKLKNLQLDKKSGQKLNFGGQNNELWCDGGEAGFLKKMIAESFQFRESCKWFSSLVSKKETLPACYKLLEMQNVADVRTINMSQGQKQSRILAWTY